MCHLRVSRDIIDPDLEGNCEYAGGKESIETSDTTDLRLWLEDISAF